MPKQPVTNCPYCGVHLEQPPKRKKKCPECKRYIYPRVNPYTNEQFYLTEEEELKFERIRDRYRVEQRFFDEFEEHGLKRKKFEKRREKYEKKAQKINQEYDGFAFIISIFNEMLSENFRKSSWQDLKMMYFSMARLLYENDQSYFTFLKEANKMELYHYKKLSDNMSNKLAVTVMAKPGACDKCLQQNGKKYTIDEALEKMPIPVKDCDNGFCRCVYSFSTY